MDRMTFVQEVIGYFRTAGRRCGRAALCRGTNGGAGGRRGINGTGPARGKVFSHVEDMCMHRMLGQREGARS